MNEAFYDWLIGEGLAETTARNYARTAERIEAEVGDVPSKARGFLTAQISSSTPSGTRSNLTGAVANWVRFMGVTDWKAPKLNPRHRVQPTAPEALTLDELALFIEAVDESAIPEPTYTILKLLPRIGLRVSEICALPAAAVTKRRNNMGLLLSGKGNKTRWVPLGKSARTVLKTYLKSGERAESAWLFPGRGEDHCSPQTVRHHLRQLRTALPKLPKLHPHMLRHTYATVMLEETGASVKDIQTLLGHSSIQTTARYLHPTADRLADLVEDL